MIALALAAIAELCAAPPPAPVARDAEAAARYVEVGDAERDAGEARTALVAYRAALARDPENPRAAAGARELCATGDEAPPAAELVEGIARLDAGDLAAARRHFTAAGEAPEVAAGAHFFLGVIAAERGDRGGALRELAVASRDPAFAGPARAMRRVVRRRGVLALSLLLAPEWDSNVALVPETPPTRASGERASDAGVLALGSALLQPWPALSIGGTLFTRRHLELSDLDVVGARAAAELAPRLGAHRPALRLELAHDRVGGERYGVALQGTVAYSWRPGDVASLGARYTVRRRSFDAALAQPYDGTVHVVAAPLHVRPSSRLDLSLEPALGRELLRDREVDAWTGGLTAGARLDATPDLRFAASAGLTGAWYDLGRRDARLVASFDAELDVSDHVALVAGVDVERQDSSLIEYRTSKVVARAGVAGYLGLP